MRKKSTGKQSGFTLIETSIALVVMMVAGLAAASLFTYAINYNSGANDRALALAVAQQRMERLRNLSFTHADLAATAAAGVYEDPNPTLGGRKYRVRKIVADTTTTLKTITIEVTPMAPNGQWARTPVTLMARRSSVTTGPYV